MENSFPLCQNHEELQVSLIVKNQGRADQVNWTSCFCPHGPKTFGSSWVSLKASSQIKCPRLSQYHRRRGRVWAQRHRNRNLQHWFHVIFVDESRFSLYHCYGHARVRRGFVERLVDYCIREADGNFGPPSWYGVLSMHQANRSWWWWMTRSTNNATLA